jgi:branched-chain amino acid transport system permease protein
VAVAAIVAQSLHGTALVQSGEGVAVSVVALSVVLVTGYGGQVSLAPYAFMGFGAWLFAKITPGGSILGLVAVALISAVLGAVVALPALRLRGLYLALSTLAFAELAYFLFFSQTGVMGGIDLVVPKVHLPFVSLSGERANLVFEVVLFALLAIGLLAVRRGRYGRLLLATRDSDTACATLGANLTLVRLLLFASSAGVAAVGGALFGGVERTVTALNFEYQLGLSVVLTMFIWGVASVAGALAAGLALQVAVPQITQHLPSRWAQVSYLLVGFGAIALGRNPNGTIGQMSDALNRTRSRLSRRSGPRLSWQRPVLQIDDEVVGVAAPADV